MAMQQLTARVTNNETAITNLQSADTATAQTDNAQTARLTALENANTALAAKNDQQDTRLSALEASLPPPLIESNQAASVTDTTGQVVDAGLNIYKLVP